MYDRCVMGSRLRHVAASSDLDKETLPSICISARPYMLAKGYSPGIAELVVDVTSRLYPAALQVQDLKLRGVSLLGSHQGDTIAR